MIVLLVEDDLDLAELVLEYLELEGIDCDLAYNGVMGLELVKQNQYDVIMLDVMMPQMDGLTLCTNIRQLGIATPCLMLTARDSLEDKLLGFERGADDYLVKPFALQELHVRLQALTRRFSNPADLLQVSDLQLNCKNHHATRNGRVLALSPIEWQLLELLLRASPKVLSRQQIEAELWPDDTPSKDALKMHLYRLRQLVDAPNDAKLLQTIRGTGIALRVSIKPANKRNDEDQI